MNAEHLHYLESRLAYAESLVADAREMADCTDCECKDHDKNAKEIMLLALRELSRADQALATYKYGAHLSGG